MLELGAVMTSKYRIERLLGRGGMGEVYAATHLGLGTQVALKFLNRSLLNNERVVQRFLREAQSVARLQNEHICRVKDVEQHDGVPYIVMDLLEGSDLAKLIRKIGPLDVATACDYVQQACAGLAEAHQAGIVHRDLKPGNLFLTKRPDGTTIIKVLDFGVAKSPAGEEDFSLTQTSNVIGSPGYMSPEQLRSSKVVDQRSDVWNLGVVLFELVVGRQPFRAEAITDLALAIAMDPTPPMPGFPEPYAAVVSTCLEKDPARRYQDVAALAVALSDVSPRMRTASTTAVDRLLESGGHAVRVRGSAPNPLPPVVPAAMYPPSMRSIHEEPTSVEQVAVTSSETVAPAMTTLSAASGVRVEPIAALSSAAKPASRVPWIPVVAGCLALGVVIALAIGTYGGKGKSEAKQAHRPAPAAKIDPVAKDPAKDPAKEAKDEPKTPDTPGPVVTPIDTPVKVEPPPPTAGSDATPAKVEPPAAHVDTPAEPPPHVDTPTPPAHVDTPTPPAHADTPHVKPHTKQPPIQAQPPKQPPAQQQQTPPSSSKDLGESRI